jgi:hypothetical protein
MSKTHIKKNGKPICGVSGKNLRFVAPNVGEQPTCKRCKAVIEE